MIRTTIVLVASFCAVASLKNMVSRFVRDITATHTGNNLDPEGYEKRFPPADSGTCSPKWNAENELPKNTLACHVDLTDCPAEDMPAFDQDVGHNGEHDGIRDQVQGAWQLPRMAARPLGKASFPAKLCTSAASRMGKRWYCNRMVMEALFRACPSL